MVFNSLKIEFKRALLNYRFLLSLIIGIAICYYGLTGFYTGDEYQSPSSINNSYLAWFTAMYQGGKSFFILIAPIICILPFSDSFLKDMKSGYLKSILNRTSFNNYIYSKIIVNGLIGGIALSLPTIIIFILCANKYPMTLHLIYPESGGPPVPTEFYPEGIFANNYALHPFNYIIFCFIQLFIFGFVYSIFAMAACSFSEKRIAALLIPLIYYVGVNSVTGSLLITQYSPYTTLLPCLSANTTYIGIYGQLLIILFISVTIISICRRRIVY